MEFVGPRIDRAKLGTLAGIEFVGSVDDSQWDEYRFISPRPLRGEITSLTDQPFRYPVVIRRSGPRILLLSVAGDVTDVLLKERLQPKLRPQLRHVSIAIDRLVREIILRPTLYALTYGHARVPGYGATLKSVSYFGEDLAEAAFFRDHHNLMNFVSCGLRSVSKTKELLRMNTEGMISFYISETRFQTVLHIEEALRFLRRNNYLSDTVLSEEN